VPGRHHHRTRGGRNSDKKPKPSYNVDVVYGYRPDPKLYSHVETYLVGGHDPEIDKYLDEDAENYLDQVNVSSSSHA
jgi:hypothetical protein